MSAADKPNPFPTKTRLKLMREIADGELRHYHFIRPETRNKVTDGLKTAAVRELVDASPPLADLGEADFFNNSPVTLTDAGREYLDTYGKNGADT